MLIPLANHHLEIKSQVATCQMGNFVLIFAFQRCKAPGKTLRVDEIS